MSYSRSVFFLGRWNAASLTSPDPIQTRMGGLNSLKTHRSALKYYFSNVHIFISTKALILIFLLWTASKLQAGLWKTWVLFLYPTSAVD
jgi:hypothetical protein